MTEFEVLRLVAGLERGVVVGVQVECRMYMAARFDCAGVRPWLRRHGERLFSTIGGNDDALVISADADLEPINEHDLGADFVVAAGTRSQSSVIWTPPDTIDPRIPTLRGAQCGNAESLEIMYGLGGERRLTELELGHLEGYRVSTPARLGNAASDQLQLDVYGYLLDLAWRWRTWPVTR